MQKLQVIGQKFKADFGGEFVFQLDFHSETQMTYAPILTNGFGESETVQTTMVEKSDPTFIWCIGKKNQTPPSYT